MDAVSFFREANSESDLSLKTGECLRFPTLRCLDPVAPALEGIARRREIHGRLTGDQPAAEGRYASLSAAGAATRTVTMSVPWYC